MHCLRPAYTGESTRHRGSTHTEGSLTLWQHKAGERGNNPGLHPLWSSSQVYHLALLQPYRSSPISSHRRTAKRCANEPHPICHTAIGIRKQLKIFGNDYNTPDKTCIRDYIYVVDLAKAHVKAMERVLEKETDPVEVFNIGTGHGYSTLEIVEGFERATGVKLPWEYAPRREGDIEAIWGNVDKANKVLGWSADTPLDDILSSAWKWQLKLREDGLQ